MAAIRPNEWSEGLTPLARPGPIGLGRQITAVRTGTLYLRINDSPAELDDNEGTLTVEIRVTEKAGT